MIVRRNLRELADDRRGSTAVEYGLIASLVVIACIAALQNFASTNKKMWENVSEEVSRG